jgi:phosphoribosylformylglycinamidine cyclo-ligase
MNYENSGVNINKGNQFVETIQEICGNKIIGGFGGIYEQNGLRLVAATDGVGTKLELCRRMNKYDTIGIDLVAMCVNDILCQGGRPLFFLDYYAMGELNLEIAEQIILGIQEGCKQSNCILLGGETAEMPLVYEKGKFDLAGFSVGVIENDIYPKKINEGDYIFGLPSTGVHSNGYSLIHKLLEKEKYNIDELMKPTKIYVNEIEKIKTELNGSIKGFAHITGGGIIENVGRILEKGQHIHITEKWPIPQVFHWIYDKSDMNKEEMFRTYNCGIGMVIIVDKNTNRKRLMKEYQLIPMGKIIESEKEVIQYDKFFN